MNDKIIKGIGVNLVIENELHITHERSSTGTELDNNKLQTLEMLKQLGKEGSIDDLLQAEKTIVKNERDNQANHQAAKNTLDNAITELNTIKYGLRDVRNPQQYKKEADERYNMKKFKSGQLPNDQTRKCFRSHRARLNNSLHYKLSPTEKSFIQARMNNLSKAEKTYVALQEKALGIGTDKDKSRNMGR